MTRQFRSIWISDVHLGTPASKADELLEFLNRVSAERIYLVGDIIDFERMRSKPFFPGSHQRVLSRLTAMAASGADIRYIPGNHDYELRDFAGRSLLDVPVMLESEHVRPDGSRLLVVHGDGLDGRVRQGTTLERFGPTAYRFLMRIDVHVNQMRKRLGRDYYPISAQIKSRLATANDYIDRFESVAAQYASERGFDGIVCGHIHRPCMKMIDGCLYANDGDWVEHGTALAEHQDGKLELLQFYADRDTALQQIEIAPLRAA